MVSKKNFPQNGRLLQHHRPGPGGRGAGAPYKKPFKPHGNNFNQMIFNGTQIPDNPGYTDFNNPTPPINQVTEKAPPSQATGQAQQQKRKNNKNKQRNKQPQQHQQLQLQQQQQHQQQQNDPSWRKNKNMQQQGGNMNQRFNRGAMQRSFNSMPAGGGNRGRRIPGPRGGPMPPPHGFQPPMIPPIPPMGCGPMPPMGMQPPPQFMRRPVPPQIPPMMAPRMPRGPPHMPFNGNGNGKIKKLNAKVVKQPIKGKSTTIITLKTLVNEYPLDKPWVTDELRAVHSTKVDIENRLKGNKDDALFAQFKTQRDKFVAMYGTAREEYMKIEAAAVKAKDAKDKQTINKTATKDGNNIEAKIPNKTA